MTRLGRIRNPADPVEHQIAPERRPWYPLDPWTDAMADMCGRPMRFQISGQKHAVRAVLRRLDRCDERAAIVDRDMAAPLLAFEQSNQKRSISCASGRDEHVALVRRTILEAQQIRRLQLRPAANDPFAVVSRLYDVRPLDDVSHRQRLRMLKRALRNREIFRRGE